MYIRSSFTRKPTPKLIPQLRYKVNYACKYKTNNYLPVRNYTYNYLCTVCIVNYVPKR